MKCDECGNDISGTYFETDEKIICKKDYDEVHNFQKNRFEFKNFDYLCVKLKSIFYKKIHKYLVGSKNYHLFQWGNFCKFLPPRFF